MLSRPRTAEAFPRPDEIETVSPAFIEVLSGLLAPGAAIVRLDRGDGGFRTASTFDAQGQHVPQPLAYRQAAASWIVQRVPGLDPQLAHELDLGTGRLVAVAAGEPAFAAA
ncbi:hypothetical protein AB0E96_01205 [Kitasatospora sp. NPDC036755]|uniref:hypothetical protein n=1 Tax=Kitasatospora sp. NPDC036755 TaxID=3154600 RepID=UPI0033F0280D